jgi:hypothetical protein
MHFWARSRLVPFPNSQSSYPRETLIKAIFQIGAHFCSAKTALSVPILRISTSIACALPYAEAAFAHNQRFPRETPIAPRGKHVF